MPMWCPSSDSISTNNGVTQPHHRIVRIPPGEAVVLNSAERAPYLLLIEILSGDLDFDPDKRANKEVLRKVMTKEVGQRGTWVDFGLASGATRRDTEANSEWTPRTPLSSIAHSPYFSGDPPTAASSSSALSDDEEIDLVEQLYGDDQPLRSRMLDIEESIVLPPTPKNRELDMATWARSSPIINSSEESKHRQSPLVQHVRAPSISRAQSLASAQSQMPITDSETTRALSLDEYSERMRTAAIMLAQLNADQSREPASTPQKPNGTSRPDGPSDRTGEHIYHYLTRTLFKSRAQVEPMGLWKFHNRCIAG